MVAKTALLFSILDIKINGSSILSFSVFIILNFIVILYIKNIIKKDFNTKIDFSKLLVLKIDLNGNIINYNKYFKELFGKIDRGSSLIQFFNDENKILFTNLISLLQQNKQLANYKAILSSLYNEYYIEFNSIKNKRTVKLIGKDITNYLRLENKWKRSMTELNNSKEKLWNLTYVDSLTNVYNKRYFIERCQTIISNKLNKGALLLLNIDNFEHCKNIFGPNKCDRIIKDIATNIEKITSKEHLVARISCNEFVVLLRNVDVLEVEHYIKQLLELNTYNVTYEDVTLHISISAGVSLFPSNGSDFDSLFKTASLALHSTEKNDNEKYIFYNDFMNKKLIEKMRIESNIRDGIDNEFFFLEYQPKYNMITGEIVGFEALIRLKDRKSCTIMPNDIIPIAEETKLIIPMGYWVIKEACLFLNRLKIKGLSDITVSINVSVVQLLQDDFVVNMKAILSYYRINPKYLEIEITETSLLHFDSKNLAKIDELRDFGITIALDDFGTGYSSLLYFKRSINISIIKIDKEFVDDLSLNDNNIEIVNTIINLAHKFKFKVIAEGVESIDQFNILAQLGCDYMQGYLGSKPLHENVIFEGYDNIHNIKSKVDRRAINEIN